MAEIFFSRTPQWLTFEGRGICVYHKQYADCLPIMPGCETVEFGYLCDNFTRRDFFAGAEIVVFVGSNKFFNPSTRFHPVFDLLQYNLPASIRKVSVDIAPYVGPIWRLWTHWSLAYQPFSGYTYSYLLESHYNAWMEGVREINPMDLATIRQNSQGIVSIDYPRYFAPASVDIIPVGESIHADYQRLKSDLFDEHDTITPIIKGLSDFARQHCPARKIPQEHKIFETPDRVRIVRTDLKVDEYLTGKLLAKIDEVNRVVEALQP